MSYTIYVVAFLVASASGKIVLADATLNDQVRAFQSLPHSQQDPCHGPRIARDISTYPLLKILSNANSNPDYIEEYPEVIGEDYPAKLDYNDLEGKPGWSKRSPVSPFISLGALSNLPQFFEQLKGTMDKWERPGGHQSYSVVSLPPSAVAEGGSYSTSTCHREDEPGIYNTIERLSGRDGEPNHPQLGNRNAYFVRRQLLPFYTRFEITGRYVAQEAILPRSFTAEGR